MLNQNKTKQDNQCKKVRFTTNPKNRKNNNYSNLHNVNNSHRTYLESDQYLPPDSLVFIQFVDMDEDKEISRDGYIPAKVDWCFENQNCYKTGIMFIDNICDQCNKQLAMEEIFRTEHHNTLCSGCYYKLQSLKNSRLKICIEKQLLGNVL